jgi:hypothetical protein
LILLARMHDRTKNTAAQAEVHVAILDTLGEPLPGPPFTEDDADTVTDQVYDYVWPRTASGQSLHVA